MLARALIAPKLACVLRQPCVSASLLLWTVPCWQAVKLLIPFLSAVYLHVRLPPSCCTFRWLRKSLLCLKLNGGASRPRLPSVTLARCSESKLTSVQRDVCCACVVQAAVSFNTADFGVKADDADSEEAAHVAAAHEPATATSGDSSTPQPASRRNHKPAAAAGASAGASAFAGASAAGSAGASAGTSAVGSAGASAVASGAASAGAAVSPAGGSRNLTNVEVASIERQFLKVSWCGGLAKSDFLITSSWYAIPMNGCLLFVD
jgi:hypothetical protein